MIKESIFASIYAYVPGRGLPHGRWGSLPYTPACAHSQGNFGGDGSGNPQKPDYPKLPGWYEFADPLPISGLDCQSCRGASPYQK